MNRCLIKINEDFTNMKPAQQRIAKYIMENTYDIAGMSIGELATKCNSSKTTIVRFCRELGFKGYRDFNIELSANIFTEQQNKLQYSDIHPEDSIESIANNVYKNNIKSIENTMKVLEIEQIKLAVDAIVKSNRLDFYGVGSSGIVAVDAQYKFLRIHKTCFGITDPHLQILAASNLSKEDVTVFISYSGETQDMVETLKVAKQSGAITIGIVKYGESIIGDMVDIKLAITSSEKTVRSGAMSSRIAQLNIIDILYTSVASEQYSTVKDYLDKTSIASVKKKINS